MMNHTHTTQRCLLVWSVLVLTGWLAPVVHAQTLQSGPFRLSIGAAVGAEYSDNFNASATNPKSDYRLTFGPYISGNISLGPKLPGGQELAVSIGGNYNWAYSTQTGKIVESFSNPASASLSLPMFFLVGSWRIEFSEALSYSTSVLDTTFALDTGRVNRFSNVASLSGSRSFGRISLGLSASRSDQVVLHFSDLTQTQYSFSITPSYALNENVSVFWRNSYYRTDIQDPQRRDSRGYSTEVGISGQITESLSGSVSVGWAHNDILPGPNRVFGGIFDGIFEKNTNSIDRIDGVTTTVALSYAQPLRPNTTHSFSVFHSDGLTGVTSGSDITEVTGLSYSITHKLNRQVTLTPTFNWLHIKSLSGSNEESDLASFGFGLSRSFSRKLHGTVSYRFQSRSSNIRIRNYDVNQIAANLSYAF